MKLLRNTFVGLMAGMLILPLAITACDDISTQDESTTLSVVAGTQTVASTATEATFDIQSNADWKVECNSDWVSSYTESGSGNGTVKVSFPANSSTEEEQSASLAVIAGKKSVSLMVIQGRSGADVANATLSLAASSAQVEAEASSYTLKVESNTIWGVYSEDSWITSYTKMGEGNGDLVINFDPYKKRKADREATFVVSAREVTKTFTLTQLRSTKIEIVDSKITPFIAEEVDEDVFFRLTGLIKSVDGTSALTIEDYSGSVAVPSLLASAGGSAANISGMGLVAGDVVTVVGTRASNAGQPSVGEAYLEASHKVESVSVTEFAGKPDGTDTYYKVFGRVGGITDTGKGCFTMSDPIGTSSVTVNGVLTGVCGEANKFESLYVANDDILTIISCGKSGSTISDAWFVSNKPGTYPPGVLAKWIFTTKTSGFDQLILNWHGGKYDDGTTTLTGLVGDTGQYILSSDQKSRMKFTQADKTEIGKWAAVGNATTCQPLFKEIWVGDAFEFNVNNEMDIPIGTKIHMVFCMRIPTAGMGCYMLEYEADGNWYPIDDSANPIKSLTLSGTKYEFNIQRTGNNTQTNQEFTFPIKHDIPAGQLKIRIRAAAPYTCGGAEMKTPNGSARFRGENTSGCSSPLIEVVK